MSQLHFDAWITVVVVGGILGLLVATSLPADLLMLGGLTILLLAGVLTVPSGAQVVRFLPALNLTRAEAAEGVSIIAGVVKAVA